MLVLYAVRCAGRYVEVEGVRDRITTSPLGTMIHAPRLLLTASTTNEAANTEKKKSDIETGKKSISRMSHKVQPG